MKRKIKSLTTGNKRRQGHKLSTKSVGQLLGVCKVVCVFFVQSLRVGGAETKR